MALPASSPSHAPLQLPKQPGTYDLKKLRGRHHLIVRLAAQGYDNKVIANALSVTPEMVCYTLSSTLAQQKMAVLQGTADASIIDVMTEIKGLAPLSVAQLEETLMYSSDEKLKVSVAQDILDRAGFQATQKIRTEHEFRMTQNDIDEIKRRARERALASGNVVLDAQDAVILDESEAAHGGG